MSLDIYLMRHGKTIANEQGLVQGWSDSPLTEEGIAGVVKSAQRFADAGIKFDAAFCSTSPRAKTTAQLVLQTTNQPDLRIQEIEDLREYNFGSFEQTHRDELHQLLAEKNGFAKVEDWIHAYRNGSLHRLAQTLARIDPTRKAEGESEFLARLNSVMFEIIGLSPRKGRILVVSHGMAITGILKNIDPMSTLYESVPNASMTRLSYSLSEGWKIHSIGDGGLRGSQGRPSLLEASRAKRMGHIY